jgi:hypothetical protein
MEELIKKFEDIKFRIDEFSILLKTMADKDEHERESKFTITREKRPKPEQVITALLITETPKALLLGYKKMEGWIPKQYIHNDYVEDYENAQEFIITTWVFQKNFGGI